MKEWRRWDTWYENVYILCIRLENVEMAELLLENGADVNIRYASGKTPLHLAIEKGNSWQMFPINQNNEVNLL